MKTRFLLLILLSGHLTMAQVGKTKDASDTSRRIQSVEGIVVNGIRAKDAPNNTLVSKWTLNAKNFGQDMPTLLEFTPSVVTTSDAGAGIGYSGLRIRGVDASRINVTINGVPVNDPESHDVYWVNMPDLVGSVENIQIQRGVGSSTNGAAAFGASVNIKTNDLQSNPYAILHLSGGSFGTLRGSISAGTGLLNKRFALEARVSEIRSDGYLDRATSNLRSMGLTATYLTQNSIWKAVVLTGAERTYQAWYGTPESRYRGDSLGMLAYAARNGLSEAETQNLLTSGRTYNYYTYAGQVDNYNQDNYQLHFIHRYNKLNFNAAAHYTYGRGYYEEYRQQDDLSDYGLDQVVLGIDTIAQTDLIRRRWLDNHFVGLIYGLNYRHSSDLNFIFGGAANRYAGAHFGEIIWAQYASNSQIYDRYYDNDALKSEVSTYLKTNYQKNGLDLTLDLQYRGIAYEFLGVDQVSGVLTDVTQNVNFNFFNPKISIAQRFGAHQLFSSFGIANREPVRRDFRESTPANRPVPERLFDTELAYRYDNFGKLDLQANLFWMYYQNQLVLTGQINDVGGYTRTNVDASYRAGLEFELGYQIHSKIRLQSATTLSQNKVLNFVEYVDVFLDTDPYYTQIQIDHGTTDLAFSPNFIQTLGVQYAPIKECHIALQTKYVSRQYLDNTSNVARSLDPFTFTNLSINYNIKQEFAKQLQIGLLVNNLFNAMYANNGYTFSYQYAGQTTTENFYYPQAGRHFLLKMSMLF